MDILEPVLKIEEVAALAKVTKWQVYKWFEGGHIMGYRLGKRRGVRLKAESVRNFFASKEEHWGNKKGVL